MAILHAFEFLNKPKRWEGLVLFLFCQRDFSSTFFSQNDKAPNIRDKGLNI